MTPAAISALAKGDISNFLVAATPGGIEAQERAGQIKQSLAETMPIDLHGQEADFLAAGFTFAEPIDRVFRAATFPKGWRKQPTDHAMWSNILDEKERNRGAIFYKAAFYDRRAHAHLSPRFSISRYGDAPEVSVKDESRIVEKRIDGLPRPNWSNMEEAAKRSDAIDAAAAELAKWLDSNYPGWRSPLNHWE